MVDSEFVEPSRQRFQARRRCHAEAEEVEAGEARLAGHDRPVAKPDEKGPGVIAQDRAANDTVFHEFQAQVQTEYPGVPPRQAEHGEKKR
ncbi:hypothetical protein [Spirilliplanes yamanashiensis]|uniref:Uncharacterized protein n=1 Tax=Spirilliplanes yamanashiensis TaxID=42233 RepID=A0A8J4DJL5_9ACTN|nr:hypothetical protein [Spirilliplanes yamanashiensis]MDP9815717.1 hypothetical protein [Spirilliplanes yamanashiensis]GIJ03971.1 hypothetical protein Sya03_33230 [Spirilliplanes yamanashiensis]